jgi:hypothetical protein
MRIRRQLCAPLKTWEGASRVPETEHRAQSKSTAASVTENIRNHAVELGGLLLRGAGKIAINVGVRAATAGLVSAKDF